MSLGVWLYHFTTPLLTVIYIVNKVSYNFISKTTFELWAEIYLVKITLCIDYPIKIRICNSFVKEIDLRTSIVTR